MRRPQRLSWPLLAVLLAVLATASPAAADYRDVYKECESGKLTTRFSAKDLKQAAQRMNSYQRDYTNCSDAIYQAQTNAGRSGGGGNGQASSRSGSGTGGGATAGSGTANGGATGDATGAPATGTTDGTTGTGGSAGGSATLTPDEKYIATQAATQAADASGSLEQMLAAAKVPDSALTYAPASASMPLPLVVALAASAVLAVLAAVMTLLARVRRARVD